MHMPRNARWMAAALPTSPLLDSCLSPASTLLFLPWLEPSAYSAFCTCGAIRCGGPEG